MSTDANGKWIGYGIGDTGPQVAKIQHRLILAYPKNSHAVEHGVTESGTFDKATAAAVIDITSYLNAHTGTKLRVDGIADYAVQKAIGAVVTAPVAPTKRFVQQGVGYNTDAFLMGDPTHSYVDACNEGSAELLRLALPVVGLPKVINGYSMGADVVRQALERWPADRRDEIKLIVAFGNPCRRPGPTLLGNDPGGQGIAGAWYPEWTWDRLYDFTQPGDMYPNSTGLLPQLYQILTRMEATTDFALYLFNLLTSSFGPLLLGTVASAAPGAGALAGILGMITPGPFTQTAGQPNLLAMITNIPAIIQTLVAALQFVQTNAHFRYGDEPQPYWRNLTAVDCAAQIITEKVQTATVYTVPGTVASWNDGPPAWTAWKLP